MAATRRRWLDRALRLQAATACLVIAGFCAASICGVRFGLGAQAGVLLGGIVAIGFPHGAFDHLVARPILSRRLGRLWWVVFLAAYLGLSSAVWVAWMIAPAATLAGFLAASILHFGLGDAEDRPLLPPMPRLIALLTSGALPVLLPAALHPGEAAPVLAALGGVSPQAMAGVLAAFAWLVPVWLVGFVWLCCAGGLSRLAQLERILTAAGFVVLPPLLAFTLYFTFGHSVRHLLRLGAWHNERDFGAAFRWTMLTLLPASLFCAAGIVGLWFFAEPAGNGLLVPVFRIIAALTLPHMIVTSWLGGHEDVSITLHAPVPAGQELTPSGTSPS
jgi:Brp/Blh family beta-carotene 15,15'-monooxygenase